MFLSYNRCANHNEQTVVTGTDVLHVYINTCCHPCCIFQLGDIAWPRLNVSTADIDMGHLFQMHYKNILAVIVS